ncbi:hypothetical protein JAAARDRAFT_71680 [Jaapia argillacea MUCL 33604]|uniref:Uncharacterized protein n=1 Tax=Jaapia argillacea MUCL 33604 TaxID=933084 RepID=A0A067PM16_9AGAM|nr:hypothetical protein JAAARDRAFT_71680 [Jaapia argillacea MUCL 33604]
MGRPLFGTDSSASIHADSCLCLTCQPSLTTSRQTSPSPPQSRTLPDDFNLPTAATSQSAAPSLFAPPLISNLDRASALASPTEPTLSTYEQRFAQTRQSLRLASSALEAAFERISELRVALRGLSTRMPITNALLDRVPAMGPQHSGILLAGGVTSNSPRADDGDHVNNGEILPRGVDSREAQSPPQDSELSRSTMGGLPSPPRGMLSHLGPNEDVPSSVPITHVNPQRPLTRPETVPSRGSLLQHIRQRGNPDGLPDDPTTSIGRRVMIRAGGEATRSRTETAQHFARRTAQLAEDLERVMDRLMTHRIPSSPRAPTPDPNPTPVAQDSNDIASAVLSNLTGTLTDTIRPLSGIATRSASTGAHSEEREAQEIRRALLGGRIGHDLASLVPESRLWPPSSNSEDYDAVENPDADPTEQRSYRIRRRLNADGDEHVHNINVDEWMDPNSPMLPPRVSRDRHQGARSAVPPRRRVREGGASGSEHARTADSSETTTVVQYGDRTVMGTNPTSSYSRRRRGWARLDADGNEISTDEEDRVERDRTQIRIRMTTSQSVDQSIINMENGTRQTMIESLIPTTRTSISHATDEPRNARVRLNAPARRYYPLPARRPRSTLPSPPSQSPTPARRDGMVGDSTSPIEVCAAQAAQEHLVQSFGSTLPYRINPLPQPVEDMTSPAQRPSNTLVVHLRVGADFAGR